MYRFSNESNFIEFSTAFSRSSTLVYPLKYSLRGVKYIKRKVIDKSSKKAKSDADIKLIPDDEKSFFFTSLFSFTKRI